MYQLKSILVYFSVRLTDWTLFRMLLICFLNSSSSDWFWDIRCKKIPVTHFFFAKCSAMFSCLTFKTAVPTVSFIQKTFLLCLNFQGVLVNFCYVSREKIRGFLKFVFEVWKYGCLDFNPKLQMIREWKHLI